MRVLVTGGAGFIGSHISELLLAEGHEVRILDALLPLAHREPPEDLPREAEFTRGDVTDPTTIEAALDGIDAVSHQAAMVGLGVDLADMPDYVHHNDVGTATLLAALARRRFDGPLVLASSMVVYGEGRYRCPDHGEVTPPPRDPDDLRDGRFEATCPVCGGELVPEAIDETGRLDPRNVYAATKLHQERLAAAAARESDLRVVALRYHNVYGPRMPRDTPYAGVASIFQSQLAADRAPAVFEDGGQRRDFVHVRDVARANVKALSAADAGFAAYNVASGEPRTILDMANALADAHGPDSPRPRVTGDFRLGDVRHVFASAERAAEPPPGGLGYRAQEDFADGMREFAHARLRAAA